MSSEERDAAQLVTEVFFGLSVLSRISAFPGLSVVFEFVLLLGLGDSEIGASFSAWGWRGPFSGVGICLLEVPLDRTAPFGSSGPMNLVSGDFGVLLY